MATRTDPATLIAQARSGDRRALARLITLVENREDGHEEALGLLYRDGGNAWTTGMTGAPGAGKSTLTSGIVTALRSRGPEVAVLAVDPSSPFSGGAILGDRVRMQDHIEDAGVYIRSMASRGRLGGIAEATPRALVVLDGAGFPEVILETVGVGQAEVAVVDAADTTVVVVTPGWGDSIQAAKAGLLEIGDIFVVNKADRPGVDETVRDLKQMLDLGGHGEWWPPVVATVATTGEGVAELVAAVDDHRAHLESSGALAGRRRDHALALLDDAVATELKRQWFLARDEPGWEMLAEDVSSRRLDPWAAASRLVSAGAGSGTA